MCTGACHANPPRILTPSIQPSSSSVISAAAAVQRLRGLGFTSAQDAVTQLGVWADATHLLQLYHRFFPDEFARSTASVAIPYVNGEPLYSEREIEFFRLVDERLFPLSDPFDDVRFPFIPICPLGVDWDLPHKEHLAIEAALGLLTGGQEFPTAVLPLGLEIIQVDEVEPDWERFKELCAGERNALRDFPLVLAWVSQSTGNVWLDTPPYTSDHYEWDTVTVDYLAREWQLARALIARIQRVSERMEAHPRYYLMRLARLWNRMVRERREERWEMKD